MERLTDRELRQFLRVAREEWSEDDLARKCAEELAEIRAQLPALLRAIAMSDRTTYEHHEKRPRDGKKPEGGTIWLTPREMAIAALRAMGEETDSLYWCS